LVQGIYRHILCGFIGLLISGLLFSQPALPDKRLELRKYLELAKQQKRQFLYAEALLSLEKAISKENEMKFVMEAVILKAEILRASGNHQLALETLWDLTNPIERSELHWHIQRLGRLAAIHHEYPKYQELPETDSVRYYIDSALVLANLIPPKFQFEIASLYNELAFHIYRKGYTAEARNYYSKSCEIFQQLGKKEYYASALSNLLDLESCSKNQRAADSISPLLLTLIENKEWYITNARAYNNLKLAAELRGDSINMWRYGFYSNQNQQKYREQVTSDKMLALREQFETEKLEQQVELEQLQRREKEAELFAENQRRQKTTVYLIIALIVFAVSIVQLMREKRLKRALKRINQELEKANERYHMLVAESNHRIKNNLQMIISMLDYAEDTVPEDASGTLENISGKIQAISALHRHLNFDIHNEKVLLSTYFEEVIEHYTEVNGDRLTVQLGIDKIKIQSERIIYMGLILNELLANSMKHTPKDQVSIQISVTHQQDKFCFSYSDGAIIPEFINGGTGIQLVKDLVERLEGFDFQLNHSQGQFQFTFYA